MTPLAFFTGFIFVVTLLLALQTVKEVRDMRRSEAYVRVRLNRLLYYRDKAKLLDKYLREDMTGYELHNRYIAIEEAWKLDKKKHDGRLDRRTL